MVKFALGYTDGFVGHFLMISLRWLDFTDFLQLARNQSSTEQVFIKLLINPVI